MSDRNITAIVLTYNEEVNLRACLESITGWCPVIVVDSFSADRTIQVASEFGATTYEHFYENHCSQWNWALENTNVETDWILALDADFKVTKDLKDRIDHFLAHEQSSYNGFYVIHRYVFWGSHIRFGGVKKFWLMGLRKGYGKGDESDMVDFRFNVEGQTKKIKGKVISENANDNDLSFWMRKQDKFSLRMAVEEELRRRNLLHWGGKKTLMGNTDEKFKVYRDAWMKLPLFIRPVLYFIYRYFIALGFLDGIGGFLYHFQQGMWFRMIVDMKIYELRRMKLTNPQLLQLSKEMLKSKTGSIRDLVNHLVQEHAH